MPPPALRVGLIGAGTVGAEVAARLLSWTPSLTRRTGVALELVRVAVRDPERARPGIPAKLLTGDAMEVVRGEGVDVVVELTGGEEPARTYIAGAIAARRHVVTANKVVMARHGPELLDAAAAAGVDVYFEAAVGGGIPLISTFRVDLAANEIRGLVAIINGTTNFMLGRMESEGAGFDAVLREAQAAGYAEADPTEDVEGHDAASKLAIMASIAFGARVHPADVYTEGITEVEPVDFRYARELGYTIKLLAQAALAPGGLEARVHPTMVPLGHPLASVDGAQNAVLVEGDLVGEVVLQGLGAGGRPTASAVVGDLIDLGRALRRGGVNRGGLEFDPDIRVLPMADVATRAYYRCRVADRPGVLAQITAIFGEEGVSISGAIQKEAFEGEAAVDFVLTTHVAPDAALQRTRRRIAELEAVRSVSSFLRVL